MVQSLSVDPALDSCEDAAFASIFYPSSHNIFVGKTSFHVHFIGVVIEDLHATLFQAMGISPRLAYEVCRRLIGAGIMVRVSRRAVGDPCPLPRR